MVSRDDGKLVLWPHYFDRALTRAQGRRVPADLAVEEPKAGQIAQACRTLGYKADLDEKAKPPSAWHSTKGRVLIPKPTDKKEAVLKLVAKRL